MGASHAGVPGVVLAARLGDLHFNLLWGVNAVKRCCVQDTHLLIVKEEVFLADKLLSITRVLGGDEAEARGPGGFAVNHNSAVDDLAVL